MKRHDWLLGIGTLLYSILFYKNNSGLNYLLFALFTGSALSWSCPILLKKWRWWYALVCHLFCAFFVFYHNTILSRVAYTGSLLVMVAQGIHFTQSVIVNALFSAYSIGGSIVFIILKSFAPKQVLASKTKQYNNWRRILTLTIGGITVILFFMLYQSANPLFKKFTEDINFNWISVDWCLFTTWGFLLIYGILNPQRINRLAQADIEYNRSIEPTPVYAPTLIDEHLVVTFVFSLLNAMLFILNILDIHQLYINPALPKNVSLSDFVHQSINAIITSIVLALVFISICFRGELNFTKRRQWIKYLVYAWIIQSVMMIISAIVRNNWYVEAYSLTYKRIGVYIYLGMALVGLVLTGYKIYKVKHAWYLIRLNMSVWLAVLCLSSAIDWDKFITKYNLNKVHPKVKVDVNYLVNLSETNLPELLSTFPIQTQLHFKTFKDEWTMSDYLSEKLYSFYQVHNADSWQSFSVRAYVINLQIKAYHEKGILNTLQLNHYPLETLEPIRFMKKLKYLSVNAVNLPLQQLSTFERLESLTLCHNINGNLSPLKNLKNLKYLCLWSHCQNDLSSLTQLPQLELLKVKYLSDANVAQLAKFPKLKILYVEHCPEVVLTQLKKEIKHLTVIQTAPYVTNNR